MGIGCMLIKEGDCGEWVGEGWLGGIIALFS